ncbi:UNVERIFIED_CONTAM: hypothetical protein RMT77_002057 [Armadillidium vulgare]
MGCCLSNYKVYDDNFEDEYEDRDTFPSWKCESLNTHTMRRSHSDSCLFLSFEHFRETEVIYKKKNYDLVKYVQYYEIPNKRNCISNTANLQMKENPNSEKFYGYKENTEEIGMRRGCDVPKEDNMLSLASSGRVNYIVSENQLRYFGNVDNVPYFSFESSVLTENNSNNKLCTEITKECILLAENTSVDDKSTQTDENEFLKNFVYYESQLDTNFSEASVVLGIPTKTYNSQLAGAQNLSLSKDDGSGHSTESQGNDRNGASTIVSNVLEKGLSLLVKNLF